MPNLILAAVAAVAIAAVALAAVVAAVDQIQIPIPADIARFIACCEAARICVWSLRGALRIAYGRNNTGAVKNVLAVVLGNGFGA